MKRMMHPTLYTKDTARGFTLIEMLAVIAIIGILTSIALPNLSGSREKARDSERVTELNQIALGLELYYNACRTYPSALTLTIDEGCPSGSGITLGTFLKSIPTEPVTGHDAYKYGRAADGSSFVLRAVLERDNAALVDDLENTIHGVNCTDTSTNFYYCVGN
jgi:prepilin-type N-terminal cleavage/methylation domain-containing protein